MRRWFVISALWLILILGAQGGSIDIPVTTTNLDQYKYRFAVSTNSVTNGVAFRVTITAKKGTVPSDAKVELATITDEKTPSGWRHSGELVKPAVAIKLKKAKQVWAADFTVSHELLKKPGLCLTFTEFAYMVVKGKRVPMPSADQYEIQLRNFIKP